MNDRNSTINIFKAIACIGILFMHVKFPEPAGTGIRALGCFGVPFFFAVSGYYLFKKEEVTYEVIGSKFKHIVEILLCSEVGYLFFSVIYHGLWNVSNRQVFLARYFKSGWFDKFILINHEPVYPHLWFLYSLAIIYLVVLCFFREKKTFRKMACVAPFLLMGIVIFQEFSFLRILDNRLPLVGLSANLYWQQTFIFRGLSFFLLGFWFSEFDDQVKKYGFSTSLLIIFIVAMEILAFFEAYKFPVAQFYVGNILAIFGVMALCIKKTDIKCTVLEFIGEKLSLYIYITHIAVQKIINMFIWKFGIGKYISIRILIPILTLIVTLLLSWLICHAYEVYKEKSIEEA